MTDTDAMKDTARAFILAMGRRDYAAIDAMLHPEAKYWVAGTPRLFSWAGTRGRAQFMEWVATPTIFLDGGAVSKFGAATADEDRVALESSNRGICPDGRIYTNAYHHLFRFQDGLIVEVKEYLDTGLAAEFFQRPAE